MTKLPFYEQATSVNDKAAAPHWSYASKGKGRKRAPATPKAAGAPQDRQTHKSFSVLSCNEDVVEKAEATTPEDHSRPEQPSARSAAGNEDPRKDVLKWRLTTTHSGKAKGKRISQVKQIKAKATATHATSRMPQTEPQSKPGIQIKDINSQASADQFPSSRPQRPQSQPVAGVQKGPVHDPARIGWGVIACVVPTDDQQYQIWRCLSTGGIACVINAAMKISVDESL